MKYNLLFIDSNHVASRIAEVIAREYAADLTDICSAGFVPETQNAQLTENLRILNIQWTLPVSINSMRSKKYDLVVNLTADTQNSDLLFPGIPPVLKWKIPQPQVSSPESFRNCADVLIVNIRDLFTCGYFHAILQEGLYLENVLDSLHDGIIAHDIDRKIVLFSRGAEEMTGLKRDDVLGKDCHELFIPDFCGEQCIFCNTPADYSKMERAAYPAVFNAPDGTRREFDVTRVPFKNEMGKVLGAVASVHDNTRVKELEARLGEEVSFGGIIGQDYKMQEVFGLIRDLAGSDFPVIVTGESGTGKELVAAAVHSESSRRGKLFITVNCGALPEGTLESELFGHVKGSFTGAVRDRKGRFELADKGTLFLDEIGELSLRMQVKLLRVLQEGIFEPVGSDYSKKVDVRVICATNRNLLEMVAAGTFREDLYYRLAVVPIEIPPLRERRNDIALLADHFLHKNTGKIDKSDIVFSEEALSCIMNYKWPGNVRQLQNAIQYALIKCRGSGILREHLPPEIAAVSIATGTYQEAIHIAGKAGRKPKLNYETVEQALLKSGGNKAKAARLLSVGRATLYNFIGANKAVLESYLTD